MITVHCCFSDFDGKSKVKIRSYGLAHDHTSDSIRFSREGTLYLSDNKTEEIILDQSKASFYCLDQERNIWWSHCTPQISNAPIDCSPDSILKKAIVRSNNMPIRTGVEVEFMVIPKEQYKQNIVLKYHNGTDYIYSSNQHTIIDNVLEKIVEVLLYNGFSGVCAHTEHGPFQGEVTWEANDPYNTAVQHEFVTYLIKYTTNLMGAIACFAPLLDYKYPGNGCHINWSLDSCFTKEVILPRLETVIHNARFVMALTNPTVNSYKRLNRLHDRVYRQESRPYISIGERESAMRVKPGGVVEYRAPDSAASPFLVQASILFLLSHSDNIIQGNQNGKDILCPRDLYGSIKIMKNCAEVVSFFGSKFIDTYYRSKLEQVIELSNTVTDVELKQLGIHFPVGIIRS